MPESACMSPLHLLPFPFTATAPVIQRLQLEK
jgi:hypothetical protein